MPKKVLPKSVSKIKSVQKKPSAEKEIKNQNKVEENDIKIIDKKTTKEKKAEVNYIVMYKISCLKRLLFISATTKCISTTDISDYQSKTKSSSRKYRSNRGLGRRVSGF